MANKSRPMDFIAQCQTDPQLSARIVAALEKGGIVTATEVMRIAKAAGFTFSQDQLKRAVRRHIKERFAAGDRSLAAVVNADDPPESACPAGCLSYTIVFHPGPPSKGNPAIRPLKRG